MRRLFVFAKTSNCKIEVPYYDHDYFRWCHILSVNLLRFGLKPEYPPTNWEEAFPKTDIKVATGDKSQRKKFEEDLSSYIDRNRNNDRVKKFTRELLATEVLAEIERIDGIIKELNDKIQNPENDEIELLDGVFLYPEKAAERAQQEADLNNNMTILNNMR